MSLELNCCILEGLEEAGLTTLEEVPTTSAFQMIQTTLHTNLGCKGGAMCMEQSIEHGEGSILFMTTIFLVLCAMLQQGLQSQ